MNILKVVIDGGWVITYKEFYMMLELIDFTNGTFKRDALREMSEKARMTMEKDLLKFFEAAIENMQFDPSFIEIIT